MIDPIDERDVIPDEPEDYEDLAERVEANEKRQRDKDRKPIELEKQPLFQTLLLNSIDADDRVLRDFAIHVAGPLSDLFGTVAAKGGDFYQKKKAQNAANADRYGRDQTLRGHLVNGMLPALHIARTLARWDAKRLRYWNDLTERLFVAGFMLHDYTKIPAVKQTLENAGFSEMEAPSPEKNPALEAIFSTWSKVLGLDAFLAPIGGAARYLHDLIHVAHNTQQLWGTANAPAMLPNKGSRPETYDLATQVSRLADLIAYIAPTPRDLVANEAISRALVDLAYAPEVPGRQVARLTYHHVAENRGVLLNLIHDSALEALTIEDQRIPLLFAPSGVVYLERYDAPPMPTPEALIPRIVASVRAKAGEELIGTGKGAKRGNVGLQVDDSYNDFFNLPEFIRQSPQLVASFIKNNKSEGRLTPIQQGGWPGSENCPTPSKDPKDARLDQIAEWAGLMEVQFRERLEGFDLAAWLLHAFGIEDLADQFNALRNHPEAKKGGIKYWWFWAAGHALSRMPGVIDPAANIEWLAQLSRGLADALPADLPESARSNNDTWVDLEDYVARVLTLGDAKAARGTPQGAELTRYAKAKGGRAKAACAICGSDYVTRKPAETAVSFQPGVYTARLPIGSSDNKRNLCSICALEQLLRQLFVENLDSGGSVEEQRVRYLSFYPSYFFTPETLNFVKNLYSHLRDMRLSDKDFVRAMHNLGDSDPARFWQRLKPFLIRPDDEEPSKRIVRYGSRAQSTFLMIGFRGFNKPADSESWILPAFLALLLPICLDVKVVASESSIPLITEADEFRETVWFDGAHPAIQAVLQDNYINVDRVLPTLQRLMAAYAIHLDTEYEPPKENWHRFVPIAHALMESPLYVFHYLKKQEREQGLSPKQAQRYIYYAETFFDNGGNDMSHAKKLVELYSQFYRANRPFQASSYTLLRPIDIVADTLLNADKRLFNDEEALIEIARGQLRDRLDSSETDAFIPKNAAAEAKRHEFCDYFVNEIFVGTFKKDEAALRGKQLNLLRSACEVLYLDAMRQMYAERAQPAAPDQSES